MRALAISVCFVLLAACASLASGSSGIRGQVTASPTCPVERYPPDPQCAPHGFVARITIRRRSDRHLVKRFKTRRDGRFTVALARGRYLVSARPPDGGPFPRCPAAQRVSVASGRFARVAIGCDSGIR
jgi:hypothetical protein